MLLNLSEVFKEQGKTEQFLIPVEMESAKIAGTKYSIVEKEDAKWTLTNIEPKRAKIEGKVKLVFDAPCDRCLSNVKVELELKPERYVVPPESLNPEDEEVDDLSFMEGYNLNTETLL